MRSIDIIRVGAISLFFGWVSGVPAQLFQRLSQVQRVRYIVISQAIILTSILGGLSFAYLSSILFPSVITAWLLGIWSFFMVFNLDRFLVLSMLFTGTISERDLSASRLLKLIPRVGVAFILAISIALPLELKIFEVEINAHLVENKQLATPPQSNQRSRPAGLLVRIAALHNLKKDIPIIQGISLAVTALIVLISLMPFLLLLLSPYQDLQISWKSYQHEELMDVKNEIEDIKSK